MSGLPAELEQLEERAAKIPLFAIFMRATDTFERADTAQGAALLTEHLRYLVELEDHNRLLAVGPLDRTPAGPMDGLCIIRADSRDQAEAIAAEEPFAKAGWRINTVRSWELSFGTLVPAARTG
ncbi:YciI family protein [Mycobacterium sp. Aquia_216]|uniref:YciI family protein n=1 Tax=Mycobacterium sp. Aquia_216 TaxID=2991729 RepID=UPI00227A5251|nr:YciI family protein [Mycobacterium sp. Aquia_216]WAJ47099.1 YciI family protein [Mycobacterium sp. Aquia_216]